MLLSFNKPMNPVQQRRNSLYFTNDNPLRTGVADHLLQPLRIGAISRIAAAILA